MSNIERAAGSAPAEVQPRVRTALVWQDDLWRLSTSVIASIVDFSHLEPRRHIPDITDLERLGRALKGSS